MTLLIGISENNADPSSPCFIDSDSDSDPDLD